MRVFSRGVLAGLIGGAVMSAGMLGGRRAGVFDKTLAEESEDWLDDRFAMRKRIGSAGTTALEQANHMAAAAAFGGAYAKFRSGISDLAWPVTGAAYGVLLYAVNIVGLAPLLGITRGERQAGARVGGQRLGMHLLYGATTALAFDLLTTRENRRPPATRLRKLRRGR